MNPGAAVADSIELGRDIVEADVRKTKDCPLILTHNARVDHTTDGSSAVTNQIDESQRLLEHFR